MWVVDTVKRKLEPDKNQFSPCSKLSAYLVATQLNRNTIQIICIMLLMNVVRLTERGPAAASEGVPDVPRATDAVGDMVDHLALGIDAAVGGGAGVDTVERLAGEAGRTFRVCGALRPAGHVRVPEIVGNTPTRSSAVSCIADCILSTR